MRLEARRTEDGRGPYRWRPVIRTPGGLALGTIYDSPEGLSDIEAESAKGRLVGDYEYRAS